LGIGRAAGTSPNIARALQRDRRHPPPDDFREQLWNCWRIFRNVLKAPKTWLLVLAAERNLGARLGLPYAFADFINSEGRHLQSFIAGTPAF